MLFVVGNRAIKRSYFISSPQEDKGDQGPHASEAFAEIDRDLSTPQHDLQDLCAPERHQRREWPQQQWLVPFSKDT